MLTGSNGQLASDIAPLLDKEGFETAPFDLPVLDISDKEAVLKTAEGLSPDIIINCAAYTQVDKAEDESELAFKVNAGGAANLADAATDVGALLIHISTDFVFDGLKSTPYTELDETAPQGVYGLSKLKGEQEVLGRDCDSLIVRTSWLYGASGHNFVKTMLRLAAERDVLRVVSDQVGTPTWTVDLAGLLVALARHRRDGNIKTGIYHYSNEGVASWYDLTVALVEEAGAMGESLQCNLVEPIPTSAYPTPTDRPPYSVLAKDKIKRDFNISIPHWRVSLRKMLTQLYGEKNA